MKEKFIMIDLKLILIPHATELHRKKPEKVDALILDKTWKTSCKKLKKFWASVFHKNWKT